MKKISMIICLLTVSTVLFAQEQVTWGVHAGINVSNISDKDPGQNTSSSSKIGLTGGIDVQLPIAPSFVIQPELNFSQLGAKQDIDDESGTVTAKMHENYLTLPVLFKYKVAATGLGIYIGPQIGYLLSAKLSGESSGTTVSQKMTDYYNKSDFAGIFGAEYYFPCNFGISARYQLGFTNIAKKDYTDDGETVKNHGFTFTVGYRF